MVHALVLVVAQAGAGVWSSGRPRECGDLAGRAVNVWERAKSPELRRYCDLVASASSKLAGVTAMAQAALDAAREAGQVLPGHAAPRVLEGRALATLGRFSEALTAFDDSKARDPRSLDDPPALLAWGRALARTGRTQAAADAYRALLPRSAALPTAERVSAEIEAALLAMTRGAAGLDEAAAALREALREAQDEAHGVAVLALALALDRRGNADEARTLLGERARGDPRDVIASSRARELLAVVPAEAHALAAFALEPTDTAGARDEWQRVLDEGPSSVWAAHARAHRDAPGGKRAAGARP
ncbi:MAG TPA: tetratricopeptide repeat protein [Polyangiaceae bacterium]|nr:tetratricopeptide repeat protein [Polyangiaceae bacterium]